MKKFGTPIGAGAGHGEREGRGWRASGCRRRRALGAGGGALLAPARSSSETSAPWLLRLPAVGLLVACALLPGAGLAGAALAAAGAPGWSPPSGVGVAGLGLGAGAVGPAGTVGAGSGVRGRRRHGDRAVVDDLRDRARDAGDRRSASTGVPGGDVDRDRRDALARDERDGDVAAARRRRGARRRRSQPRPRAAAMSSLRLSCVECASLPRDGASVTGRRDARGVQTLAARAPASSGHATSGLVALQARTR